MGAIISTNNWLDEAGVTLTPYSTTMTRPLSELTTPWGDGLARGHVGGVAVIIFDIDLLAARSIITLGMLGMQGTANTQFFLSNVSAGGTDVASLSIDYESEWGFPFGPACWIHATAGTAWSARYLRVRVDVFEGSPTWVDARRLWIGGGLILTEGLDTGWQVDFKDGSPSDRTPDGAINVSERQRWRRLTGGRTRLTDAQAIGGASGATPGLFSQLARVGRSREIVAAVRSYPDSADERLRYFNTVYGQLVGWQPLRSKRGNKYGIDGFEIEEVPMQALS